MAIQILCGCGTNLSFDEAQIGQSGPCYNCGQTIFVTAPPSPVAVAAAAMSAPAAPVTIPEVAPGSAQTKFLKKLGKEAAKTGHQVDGARVLQLREPVGFAEAMKYKLTSKIPIDRIMGVFVRGPSGPFILSVPFSGSLVMAHEFASRIPGTLPANLYLTRGLMGAWSNGRFSANSDEEHPLARAAESKGDLGELIEWNWENGKSIVKLGWGLQAVPASPNDTLHVMQTAVQGIVFKDIGLAWYEKRRAAFVEFQAQHGGPVQSEPRWDFEPYSLHFASAL
ncbi:MAG: hypothetical protein AB8H86_28885 [Polyangiales bacterium]